MNLYWLWIERVDNKNPGKVLEQEDGLKGEILVISLGYKHNLMMPPWVLSWRVWHKLRNVEQYCFGHSSSGLELNLGYLIMLFFYKYVKRECLVILFEAEHLFDTKCNSNLCIVLILISFLVTKLCKVQVNQSFVTQDRFIFSIHPQNTLGAFEKIYWNLLMFEVLYLACLFLLCDSFLSPKERQKKEDCMTFLIQF